MCGSRKAYLLLGVAAVAFWPSVRDAKAADDADIRLLKARIAQVEEANRLLKEQLQRLESKIGRRNPPQAAAKPRTQASKPSAAPSDGQKPAPLPILVNVRSGLTVETPDHDYSFHLGGRALIDGGGSTQPQRGYSELVGVNQARLQVEGKVARIWEYRFQYDFAGNNTALVGAIGGLRDAYILLKHPLLSFPFAKEPLGLQVGNFYEPMGLERTNSKNFTSFIERSLATEVFGPARHIGVGALLHGGNWSVKGGLFSTSLEDRALTPTAAVGVPAWVNSKAGWVATGGSQYFDVAGRATYAPVMEADRLLHFGLSGRYHQPNSSTAINDDRVLTPGSNTAMESNVLKENLLGTPDLSCGATLGPNLSGPAIAGRCVKNVVSYGAEFAGAYGPFSIQAEYLGADYQRRAGAILAANRVGLLAGNAAGPYAPGGDRLKFHGFYAFASLFLTGESRADAYQVSRADPANFRQINIKNPVSAGGIGAWEVLARYSAINLNNGPFQGATFANLLAISAATGNAAMRNAVANSGVLGGGEEDITVGMNWYPDPGFRLMFNWTRVVRLSAPWDRPYLNGAHPNTFLVRTQVDW